MTPSSSRPPLRLFCSQALLAEGWRRDVAIDVDEAGRFAALVPGASPEGRERAKGPVVPALANLHSHAFQRAMAGLAERAGSDEDSFWTWRDEMYRVVGLMNPERLEAVATRLYIDMLKGGFGRVAEFHYLHHGPGGVPYADRAATSHAILAAARTAGIGLTHLPVFYAHGNFGGAAPGEGQRPFLHSVDDFLALLDTLRSATAAAGARLGLAIHSLRAATPDEMRAVLPAMPEGPIHIHIAEQEREVEDCLAWSGRRPVEWLLNEMPVDARWCAIHATHMTEAETAGLAASGAVAGLCPATEANLGDGLFPATGFLKAGGRFGIGTDSHVATGVAEGRSGSSNTASVCATGAVPRLASGPGASIGRTLLDGAVAGGAQALGLEAGGLRVGASADLVVLDGDDPFIATAEGDAILDRWLFALGDRAVRDVAVDGRFVIRDGLHEADEAADAALLRVLEDIA